MNEPFEDFVGNTKQRYWAIDLRAPTGFFGFEIAPTSALRQILGIFGILRRRKQEERKPHNQDFGAAPAWRISSGKTEPG